MLDISFNSVLKKTFSIDLLDEHTMGETYEIVKPSEAREIAIRISANCPDPSLTCMGLTELLLNAIEHGNLSIGYEFKSELLRQGTLDEEIEKRLELPCFRDKVVTVKVLQLKDCFYFVICDEGAGFDPAPFVEIDENRLSHFHGRGIAMAGTCCFSDMRYNDVGNIVLIKVNL